MRPDVHEHWVLEVLDGGFQPEREHAFVRAMFACMTRGWVSYGRVTDAGRAALTEARKPIRGEHFIVVVMPPGTGWEEPCASS